MKYLFPLSPWNQQRQFEKPVWVYPVHLAMFATHLRNKGFDVVWDANWRQPGDRVIQSDRDIDIPFKQLPYPDRMFTDAKNKRWQKYGNYKYHPATHMMVSNLCWWGKCAFCMDKAKLDGGEHREVRSVSHVMEEIENLIANGYKEVFDDSGTLPDGQWRVDFLKSFNLLHRKLVFSCNLRLADGDFLGMCSSGFRMVLVGIESANQETLDKINKGTKADNIIPILKKMSEAGLEPHITVMFGYPWETNEDAMRTVNLVHYLLKKGYAKTAQASVYSPPRTLPDPESVGHKYVKKVYDVYKSPEFLWRKLTSIREWADITYLLRSGRLVLTEKYKPRSK